ncbi:collagen alpha-1(I) chain-like [Vulpes lagopus]|uniref:collagen alpha-1(I) chain-like n=1 Tax=Vulpes lagopus TaxID=494514 RepID=UPI001BC97C85|nr:collagen alpha-1(I) chain-like [Vulpes lagopus]
MRPLRGPSRVEVGQGDPDAAHGRRAEKGTHAGPRGPRASSLHPTGCWFPQRREAQPNRTATSCQSQGLREDGAEGRGGLTEFVHTPWSTGKTQLTSSGRSEQRGSDTKARTISCHRRKTRKRARREEHMFRNAHKRPHQSPDVCSQTEKTTVARGSGRGARGQRARTERRADYQSLGRSPEKPQDTAGEPRAGWREPGGRRPSPSRKLLNRHVGEHSSCPGRWGRVKTEAPRAWPPALLTGTSGCPGGRSEPTAPSDRGPRCHPPTRCGLCITLSGGDALPPASNPRINVGARGERCQWHLWSQEAAAGARWARVTARRAGRRLGPAHISHAGSAAAGNTHPELREQPPRPLSEPCSPGARAGQWSSCGPAGAAREEHAWAPGPVGQPAGGGTPSFSRGYGKPLSSSLRCFFC